MNKVGASKWTEDEHRRWEVAKVRSTKEIARREELREALEGLREAMLASFEPLMVLLTRRLTHILDWLLRRSQ